MKDVLIVAEKEIRDHLLGKRFIALFAVVIVLCIVGMVLGMNSYNDQLKNYKEMVSSQAENQYFRQQISDLQKQIDDAEARGDSPSTVEAMKASLDGMTNPPMPSVLIIFNFIGVVFTTAGALLAIVMGFDLVTREKESGTLKLLLTRPTYRDSVINGKAIAGFGTIVVVFAAAFLLTLAVMLLYNVVPGLDDLIRVVAFFAVSMLFILFFFAMALLVSTVARSSAMAILACIGLFILMVLVMTMGGLASMLLIGSYPTPPDIMMQPLPESAFLPVNESAGPGVYSSGVSYGIYGSSGYNESDPHAQAYIAAMAEFNNETQAYYTRQQQISDLTMMISPMGNYLKLNEVIISKQAPYQNQMTYGYGSYYSIGAGKEISLWESLGYRWLNLLGLLVWIIAAFGLSYIFFMRMDVA